MVGHRPLYQPDVLESLLDTFEANRLFAPKDWGLDERAHEPYSHTRVAKVAEGKPSDDLIFLRRPRQLKQTTILRLDERPGAATELSLKTPPSDWHHLFSLGDALAAAYQPDIAWVHIYSDAPPPFTTEAQELKYLMDAGVTGFSVGYRDNGPGGLGLRTYIGPRLIELFGRELLLATPAVVAELPWGGACIDLVDQPWQADLAALASAWRVAMDYLRPAEVFAAMDRDEQGYVYLAPGARFTLRWSGGGFP